MTKLSIVIPTYDRNKLLLDSVEKLLTQLTLDVELIILDNASSERVEDTLSDVLKNSTASRIQVVRNIANIGAYANILRSFEVAQGPWVWILGDDDEISSTSIRNIFECIENLEADTIFINFRTQSMGLRNERPTSFYAIGQEGFVDKVDYPGNINFMSVGLWHAPSVIKSLGVAYHYAYSMSPTFILLLNSLEKTKKCLFSNITLIGDVALVESAGKWRFRDFILGWNTILELPISDSLRTKLSRKMKGWHSPENVCVYFLAEAALRNKGNWEYRLVSNRLAIYSNYFEKLRFYIYRALFIFPDFGWSFLRLIVNLAIFLNLKAIDLKDISDRSKLASDDRR